LPMIAPQWMLRETAHSSAPVAAFGNLRSIWGLRVLLPVQLFDLTLTIVPQSCFMKPEYVLLVTCPTISLYNSPMLTIVPQSGVLSNILHSISRFRIPPGVHTIVVRAALPA